MIFLLIYVPVLVIAWTVSPSVGVIATAAFVFLAFVGSDTWAGSGAYKRRRR